MGKRYYWLKLKDDFFNDKRIKKLRKVAGGDTYTIIYLKLMLATLDSDGIYEYEGIEEYLADEIALTLDEDADNVQITLNYLMQSGLMVELDENNYELPMVKESIGAETSSAKRVRAFRERQKALQCNTDVTEEKHFGNVEKEIEKDKEIDKEIEKDKEKREDKEIEKKKKKDSKESYGALGNVKLTIDEYNRLVTDYGYDATQKAIEYLDGYIADKGYKSKDNNRAMRRWVFDAVKEQEQKRARINGNTQNKPSFDVESFLAKGD